MRSTICSVVGGADAVCESIAARIERRCSGDVPQQPPTMAAPPSTAKRAYSAIKLGDPE
jgi:hypothetical protein